jgi:hypothetical protein
MKQYIQSHICLKTYTAISGQINQIVLQEEWYQHTFFNILCFLSVKIHTGSTKSCRSHKFGSTSKRECWKEHVCWHYSAIQFCKASNQNKAKQSVPMSLAQLLGYCYIHERRFESQTLYLG